MNFLSALTRQLGEIFNSQTAARKMMLLAIVLGSVAAMVWIVLRAQTGGYTLLYGDMAPGDVGSALTHLKELGIDAKPGNGNTSIMVARNKSDEASMALAMSGMLSSGQLVGYEKMDSGAIGQSHFQQQKQYLRMREGELARSLMTIKSVQKARVHLAIPEDTVFIEEKKHATASVNLVLRNGSRLSDRQVQGIVNLVSFAVEGMQPSDVTVVDQDGSLLTSDKRDSADVSASYQQNFKLRYEDQLKQNIERQLEKFVGMGKVDAQISAQFDFSTLAREREIYNPDDQEAMKIREEVTSSGSGLAGTGQRKTAGAPGSASNLPMEPDAGRMLATGGAAAQPIESSSTSRVEYAISKTRETSQQTVPTPTKISVSVAVDGTYETDEEGEKTYSTRSDEEIADIAELVKAAIGFDAERGDIVKVQCHRFHDYESEESGKTFLTYEIRRMIEQIVQWGIVGLIGLLMITMVLRPAVKQIMVAQVEPVRRGASKGALPAGGGAALSGNDDRVEEFRTLVNKAHQNSEADGELNREQLTELAHQAGLDDDAIQELEIESLAAAAMDASVKSEQIQKQIHDAVKEDPRKTASLLRAWMEES